MRGCRSVIACKARSRGFALDDCPIGKSRLRSISRPHRDRNRRGCATSISITEVHFAIGAFPNGKNYNLKRAQRAPAAVAR
jgi:hypothetical protein